MGTEFASRGNGTGHGGPARGYRWADAGPGNMLAVKSGFWIDPLLRKEHRAELEEIGEQIWLLLPFKRPEFAPTVGQLSHRLWRQRRAYRDLSEHGSSERTGVPLHFWSSWRRSRTRSNAT